ncbi:MAG: hemolysin family protein [Dysgonamonadaceae bacterium]|jgi:CBS domain containing-hemolysin-like protein|nr:hemolysin family protein [Dysgonamonadaceae bacterium]MDD3901515.1 hemolysin family protein [Dysgonamonadaceae bacterium]MDD4399569.1 hemolysin family protein [Dysgonamonadaceae bacterium]MEA5082402.1 hemolysin family protein [Dysgonamonadaceae bacterium]
MSDSTEIWLWSAFLMLLAFFSTMEVAFVSSDKLRYALDKKSKGTVNYMLNTIYSHPRQFLGTLNVGYIITLILFVGFSILIAYPFLNYLLIILACGLVIFIISVVLPRLFSLRNPNKTVKILIIPAYFFYVLLYPIAKILVSVSRGALAVFGVRTIDSKMQSLGRIDLDSYLKQGIEELPGEEDVDSEVKIFRNALDFSSLKIRDCMVPRTDIVAVSSDTDIETLKSVFIETGLSKVLVYEDNIDNIIGYIHMWEMFNEPSDWTKRIASISFIPESMQANKLMSELMAQRKSIAVVVDEFGGTSGIVTMEDLVEEIFGEIEDEYDVNAPFVKKENENEYVLSGRFEINQLNDQYGFDFPENEEYSTIAGYLLYYLQRFPKTYETIIIGKFTFKILKVTARKIEVIRLIVNPEEAHD